MKENYRYSVCPCCGVLKPNLHYPHCAYDPKMPASPDPKAPITEFKQEYRFLSNFWPVRVRFGMYSYPTVEHAYQAAKTTDRLIQEAIRDEASPSMAKRIGSTVKLRPDWNQIRLEVMADLLWQKFVLNSELRKRLLDTGERELIEGNTWKDTYWGRCNGTGQNHLGRLLMLIRATARYLDENQHEHQELHVDRGSESDGCED